MAKTPIFDSDGELQEIQGAYGVDLPITLYDRPSLALGNLLLRGDVDGITRSLFAPDTLTPAQQQTIRTKLMGGKKNPLMETLLDITTNPLVIGAILLNLRYPVGTTKAMAKLFEGASTIAKPMFSSMSQLQTSFMNLANLPKIWEDLMEVWSQAAEFIRRNGKSLNGIFTRHGKTTKAENYMLSAWLQGWHKPGSRLQTELGLAKTLAPNLEAKMGPKLVKTAKEIRKWLDDVWGQWDPEALEEVASELKAKGIKLGGKEGDYFPIINSFEAAVGKGVKAMGKNQYKYMLESTAPTKIASSARAREGLSVPKNSILRKLEEIEATYPGMTDDVAAVVERRSAGVVEGLRSDVQSVLDAGEMLAANDRANILADAMLTRVAKAHYSIQARLGNEALSKSTARVLADKLLVNAHKPDKLAAALEEAGRVLASPPTYDMNTIKVLPKYLTATGNSWAWWNPVPVSRRIVRGTVEAAKKSGLPRSVWGTEKVRLGKEIMEVIAQEEAKQNVTPFQKVFLVDELIPMIRGMKHWRAFSRAANFNTAKQRMAQWVRSAPILKNIPKEYKQFALDYLEDPRGSFSADNLGNMISRYFYLSTLGGNVSASDKNLMQNFLTTLNMPGIGARGMLRGLLGYGGEKGLVARMERYIGKLAAGEKHEEAFVSAFDDFVDAMGAQSSVMQSMLHGDLAAEGHALAVGAKGVLEKGKKALMLPFAISETFNKLWGFYAGKYSHMYHAGVGAAEAAKYGRNVVFASHFPGGPLGMPRALLGMWGPWRQFMHFPLRFAGFLTGSTRWGPDPTKLDFGTIARTVGVSAGIAVGANKLLGTDLSPGLVAGALPLPTYGDAPFYPFPFVPPLASLIGGAVMGAHQGSTEPIEKSWGLLVPGGIALRRLMNTAGPGRADYRNRTPEGRIPIYNNKQALIGTYSPWEFTMKAMGVMPQSVAAEQAMAGYLLKQRDRIREYRRLYLEALSDNDTVKADKINAEFKKVYPELGKIQVKKSDIRAVHNRHEISRVSRISKGLPRAYRPLFDYIIAQSSMYKIARDLEESPMAVDLYSP